MQLQGFDSVRAKLDTLGKNEARKIARKALRRGGKVVQREVMSLAPVKSGMLKRNIKVRAVKSKKKGAARIQVGMAKKFFTGPFFYAGMVVFGHLTGKRGSANRHKVEPNRFMEKGYENSKSAALNEMTDAFKELTA